MNKWNKIKVKCDNSLKDMSNNLENLKKDLFMNKLRTKMFQIELFEKNEIDTSFKNKVNIFYLNLNE